MLCNGVCTVQLQGKKSRPYPPAALCPDMKRSRGAYRLSVPYTCCCPKHLAKEGKPLHHTCHAATTTCNSIDISTHQDHTKAQIQCICQAREPLKAGSCVGHGPGWFPAHICWQGFPCSVCRCIVHLHLNVRLPAYGFFKLRLRPSRFPVDAGASGAASATGTVSADGADRKDRILQWRSRLSTHRTRACALLHEVRHP